MYTDNTIILESGKMSRSSILSCLNKGICEVAYSDSSGEEHTVFVTRKTHHIEDSKVHDWVDFEHEMNILVVWDMNGDEWRGGKWIQIPISRISRLEQLTGVTR